MRTATLKRIVFKIAMVVIVIAMVCPPAPIFAGQKAKPLPAFYPKKFTFTGCLQRIRANEAVISDGLLKFAPGVTFNTFKAKNTGRSWFKPGRRVGVIVNANHKIESMWYLSRKCR